MSWTYDASLLSEDTAIGRRYVVRLSVGDTDTTDQQVQDEEIDFYLAQQDDNIRTATIELLKALVAKYSRDADLWIGHTRIQRSQRARNFRLLLEQYQAFDAATMVVGMAVSGQTLADKEAFDTDTAAVQPSFRIGMDDLAEGDS